LPCLCPTDAGCAAPCAVVGAEAAGACDVRLRQVFVGGLSNRCSEDELFDYFASMGDVTDVMIPVDRDANTGKGFGFVVFAEEAAALKVTPARACYLAAPTLADACLDAGARARM
jgi:hypothetical protein